MTTLLGIKETTDKISLESIVHFQTVEAFEEATGLVYDELSDNELLGVLGQWHYPGEHDENVYDSEHINTPFLGYQCEPEGRYLLSRYEDGLVIGLSYITTTYKTENV
jgi:hypothetical protein